MSEPDQPNQSRAQPVDLIATWRGQPTRIEAQIASLQQQLDRIENRPPPEIEPLVRQLEALTLRLAADPQVQRLEQTGKSASELATALEATTRRLTDLVAELRAQRFDHERRRRLLLWLPITALLISLATNGATVWLAWDSNRTILAAWSWKNQIEGWASWAGQMLQDINQRLAPSPKPSARPQPK